MNIVNGKYVEELFSSYVDDRQHLEVKGTWSGLNQRLGKLSFNSDQQWSVF